MEENDHPNWPWLLSSALLCGAATVCAIILQRVPGQESLAMACYTTAYVAGGWEAAIDTLGKLKRLRIDIHFLMLAVALGAAFIGAWWEGAALLFLFSLSNALEAMAMARTDRAIRSLFHDAPKHALEVLADGKTCEVEVQSLSVGTHIRILPGEQFPADALVTSGESAADESTLTGEAAAVDKNVGSRVFGGTINGWGRIDAEVVRAPGDSAHARIIKLIREAQASKAPSQRFTDRFGTGYTVTILLLSLAMFLIWHFAFGVTAFQNSGAERSAFYRAMTLLVVCSPCALVISIPSAILAGIASGARRGILFRGGVALENLATINRLAVDKTGTLTRGEPEIIGIEAEKSGNEDQILAVAAALSRNSTHPLSRAIVAAQLEQGAGELTSEKFVSHAGKGLEGIVEGETAILGRRSIFSDQAWIEALPDPAPGVTEVLVSFGKTAGRLLLRDAIRTEAAETVSRLQGLGIEVTMLTGDREDSAKLVGETLGLRDWRFGLHPEEKVEAIRKWRDAGERVAMAGDGVNDAPSLAMADVSIGMGLRGSDAVLEQADIVLTKDKLERILEALDLSKRCRRIIRQNLAISLGVVVILGIAAMGRWIPLPIGVLGHEGSTVVVVLNSLRLLWGGARD